MIIGIGGVSNAGKSTLARKIRELYPSKKIRILCQDDYVKPHYELPRIGQHIDWESPESIDFPFYISQVKKAARNADMVIAEGLFAYENEELTALYDKKIFLYISKDTFFRRKRADERWGKEPEWYIRHIWNSYLKYGDIHRNLPDVLYLSGEKHFPVSKLTSFIESKTAVSEKR